LEDASLSSFALLLGLIVVHGVLYAASAALSNFRRSAMRDRADGGESWARRMMLLADRLPSARLAVQMASMLVRFAVVCAALLITLPPLIALFPAPSDAFPLSLQAGALLIVVLILTAFLTWLIGEVAAGALGAAFADELLSLAAPLLRVLLLLLYPAVWAARALDAAINRLTGGEVLDKAATEEEIMTLVDESQQSGAIEDAEKEMIYSVLQFGETLVREVMVPRPDITALPLHATLGAAVSAFIESGHSRIPVYENAIDNVRGMLYAKDLLRLLGEGARPDLPIADRLRPAYFVPETKRADDLFAEMQRRKMHIAIVVDEYGGTAGIVTLEDLIEEIVGDIRDEYDFTEEDEYVQLEPNVWLVDGGINLNDLNDLLETDLPNDENDSLGGYIYSHLGHVPAVGETLEQDGLFMRIEAVDNRRIRKVHIARITPALEEEEAPQRGRERSVEKPAPDDESADPP
jgi:CBS domain containing-hemolysin-like protein